MSSFGVVEFWGCKILGKSIRVVELWGQDLGLLSFGAIHLGVMKFQGGEIMGFFQFWVHRVLGSLSFGVKFWGFQVLRLSYFGFVEFWGQ